MTAPYLKQALEALPQIKSDRKIFFLENWLDAFIYGQLSSAAQAEVHRYLDTARMDKDLRLKIVGATRLGIMPPPKNAKGEAIPTLTDDEYLALESWLFPK